ncbi:MAG: MFS transporter [Candidatus Bathyarchaeia archaeon]
MSIGRALEGVGRDAKLLLTSSFIGGVSFAFYFLILPFYLLSAGYDATWVGTVNAVFGVSMTVFIIPAGILSDAFGRKRFNLIGYVIMSLGIFIMALSPSQPAIIGGAALSGFGAALTFASSGALLAGSVPIERLTAIFSYSYFLSTFASSLGSVTGWLPALLADSLGFTRLVALQTTMAVGALVTLLPAVPLLFVHEVRSERKGRARFSLESRGIIAKFMLVNIFIGFGAGLTIPLFPVYFWKKFGIDSGPMGTLQAMSNLVAALAYLAAPKLASRMGRVRGIVVTTGISIPLLVLIPLSPSFLFSTPFFIARQALINMNTPLIDSLIMRLVDEKERATASGVAQLFWNLPNSFGQPVGGFMIDKIWIDAPPFSTAAFYAVYTTMFWMMFRKVKDQPEA